MRTIKDISRIYNAVICHGCDKNLTLNHKYTITYDNIKFCMKCFIQHVKILANDNQDYDENDNIEDDLLEHYVDYSEVMEELLSKAT